jgi:hypothetical protein
MKRKYNKPTGGRKMEETVRCSFCGKKVDEGNDVNYWGHKEVIEDDRRYHKDCVDRRNDIYGKPEGNPYNDTTH